MMNADELSAAVEKLQKANPTLQYDIDYDIDERGMIRVNGMYYLGDEEYWEMKYPVKSERPTIVEKLGHDKMWWTEFTMEFRKKTIAIMTLRKSVLPKKVQAMKKASALSKLRKSVLAKKVQDRKKNKQAPIVQDVPSIQATSDPSQEPIGTRNIAPKALPKLTWKIFDEPPKQVVATSKGGHQLTTSKGGQVYRGKPRWLKGCAGILQDVQPAGLLGIGDILAIGVMGVG